ncbi:hypothetical protein KYK29_10460 [Shinella daejeonensis]|uniref:hypothetical protein n=1 Tax=Shinella daejeonensis TaxID=659017 RepID=UPI0020C7BBBC|nr:hypothetical protein [Shinella daejeonensis]MCP8895356.1 hypothetical protein [Shinella daejeonensis]
MGIIESFVLSIIASIGTTSVLVSNLLYVGLMGGALVGGAYLYSTVQSLFVQKPSVPRPEDGSYNLKQNVPSLPIVYGTVKKGGDYVFLEETEGTAYHIIVWSGRRINGFTRHYLHDKPVTLDADGFVIDPDHFVLGATKYVRIRWRDGEAASTAYGLVVSAFGVWTNNHRGDGLASVLMLCKTAPQKDYLKIFPNQMPEHSAIGQGALLYDPRKDSTRPGGSGPHRWGNPDTWEFSRNLALIRLDHLTKPYGGKLSYSDMYMQDWMHAADVADEDVTNRSGGSEKRYHGGIWFRANNDPIEVGRQLDEAGEMVVYERAGGQIGVHAGEYVEPTVRLTVDDIFSISVDKNRRKNATVLAVRGRYINRTNHFNTEDAAIYGSPYGVLDDNSERTKTFDNVCIQSHNHCQRKQKLTFTRANARRVTVSADYRAAKGAAYSRFVRVHYPSRGLVEAVIEVTGTVNRDLRNMRISFSGIVVPASLYAFDAATEEGTPGEVIEVVPDTGVPVPENFSASIRTEVVAGGGTAAFARATWTLDDVSLVYELEWEPTDLSEPARSIFSDPGKASVRSAYLADGKEYRLRLRAWGGGTSSDWTAYQTLTATADPVAPGPVANADLIGGVEQAEFEWKAPNSANYFASRLYLNTSNTMTGATLVGTEYGPPATADSRVITGLSAGTYYGFIVSINASGVAASAVATGAATVT